MTEPIPKQVTRWSCPHCHRSWSKRRSASDHIERCWFNPANRSCKTCFFRVEPDEEYGYVTNEGCLAGVKLERDPEHPSGVFAVLPLHCEKWEKAE